MACALMDEYTDNIKKYLRYKHQCSKASNQKRKNMVLRFLEFCCAYKVKAISGIEQKHFDKFIQLQLKDKSIETKRKYRLALREFFTRAHLDIEVSLASATKRAKYAKLEKLKAILGYECSELLEQHKKEILKIL